MMPLPASSFDDCETRSFTASLIREGSPGNWLDPPTAASTSSGNGGGRGDSGRIRSDSQYGPPSTGSTFSTGAARLRQRRWSGAAAGPTTSTSTTPPDQGCVSGGRSSKVTTSSKATEAVISMFCRLAFWPLTLTMILVVQAYGLLLRVVGCRSSSEKKSSSTVLRFRDPPPPPPGWLVRLMSSPFRLMNPPVSLGTQNLKSSLAAVADGGAGRVTVAAAPVSAEPEARRLAGTTEAATTTATAGEVGRAPGVLLVGNQTLLGLNSLAMLEEVHRATGVYPCLLYDTLFSFIPGVKHVLEAAGGASGTAGNCEVLMSAGRCLLLCPGGAREAFKASEDDKHQLMWDGKIGFAHLAVKHGYSVLPFAAIGLEDAVSVAFGIDVTRLAGVAESKWRSGGCGGGGGGGYDNRLRLPVLFPYNSFERQYFAFGQPIETAHLGGDWENTTKCSDVYAKAKSEVEGLLDHLQQVRGRDPDRYVLRRAWRAFRRMPGDLQDDEGTREAS